VFSDLMKLTALRELQIERDHPQAEKLQAARDHLWSAAAERGLSAFVSDDWADLLELNRQHRDSWFEMFPAPATVPRFWVGVKDDVGDVVTVQASILLDCSKRSYARMLEDMTVFYDRPDVADSDGAWCFCACPEARETRGSVAMMSSGWSRPDYRGRDLFHLVGRLNRLVAISRWKPDWLAALVEPTAARLWTESAVGERHVDRFPTIMFHQPGEGRLKLHLLRLEPAACAEDLQRRAFSPR
jgi:hypothetical protein